MSKSKQKSPDIFQNAGQEVESQQPEKRFNIDRAIEDLVGSLCDPIIVWPSPWMDTLPEDIKKEVPLARMIMLMRYQNGDIKEMTATDAEALLYMYPASLEAPMGHDWSEIYIYLGALVCGGMGREVPDDLKETKLSKYQLEELERLKRWIYEKRRQHRVEKAKDIRKERLAKEKEEELEKAPEVIQHTFDLGLDD